MWVLDLVAHRSLSSAFFHLVQHLRIPRWLSNLQPPCICSVPSPPPEWEWIRPVVKDSALGDGRETVLLVCKKEAPMLGEPDGYGLRVTSRGLFKLQSGWENSVLQPQEINSVNNLDECGRGPEPHMRPQPQQTPWFQQARPWGEDPARSCLDPYRGIGWHSKYVLF